MGLERGLGCPSSSGNAHSQAVPAGAARSSVPLPSWVTLRTGEGPGSTNDLRVLLVALGASLHSLPWRTQEESCPLKATGFWARRPTPPVASATAAGVLMDSCVDAPLVPSQALRHQTRSPLCSRFLPCVPPHRIPYGGLYLLFSPFSLYCCGILGGRVRVTPIFA